MSFSDIRTSRCLTLERRASNKLLQEDHPSDSLEHCFAEVCGVETNIAHSWGEARLVVVTGLGMGSLAP